MQGIGTVAIDGPRFQKFFEVSQGGSRKDFAVGLPSWVIFCFAIWNKHNELYHVKMESSVICNIRLRRT